MTTVPTGYRDAVRAVAAEAAGAGVHDGAAIRATLGRLGERGLLEQCVTAGGPAGPPPVDYATFRVLVEELAATGVSGLALTAILHVGVFVPMVARLAAPAVRAAVLGPALAGDLLGTLAVTESPGSDVTGLTTRVDPEDGALRVRGRKEYVTSVLEADAAVVLARHAPGRDFASFTAVLVPLGGVPRTAVPMAVMAPASIGTLDLDVLVPADHALGRARLGLAYVAEHIAAERLAGGIWAAAAGAQCLAEAYRYAVGRTVEDRSLWETSAVRQRLARAVAEVALLDAAVTEAVRGGGAGDRLDPLLVGSVKSLAPGILERAVRACLQLRGAAGLRDDSPLLRLLADARAFGVAGGPTEVVLEHVAGAWAARSGAV